MGPGRQPKAEGRHIPGPLEPATVRISDQHPMPTILQKRGARSIEHLGIIDALGLGKLFPTLSPNTTRVTHLRRRSNHGFCQLNAAQLRNRSVDGGGRRKASFTFPARTTRQSNLSPQRRLPGPQTL